MVEGKPVECNTSKIVHEENGSKPLRSCWNENNVDLWNKKWKTRCRFEYIELNGRRTKKKTYGEYTKIPKYDKKQENGERGARGEE